MPNAVSPERIPQRDIESVRHCALAERKSAEVAAAAEHHIIDQDLAALRVDAGSWPSLTVQLWPRKSATSLAAKSISASAGLGIVVCR